MASNSMVMGDATMRVGIGAASAGSKLQVGKAADGSQEKNRRKTREII
jgi:hypothetical protein